MVDLLWVVVAHTTNEEIENRQRRVGRVHGLPEGNPAHDEVTTKPLRPDPAIMASR